MELNAAQLAALRRIGRPMDGIYTGGFAQLIQDILDLVEDGNIGIEADAADVDSLAGDGGAFSQDADTTTGLTFGYKIGRLYDGKATVSVAAGTIALSASSTNYVEVTRAGVVTKNTGGFTSGSIPLYQITTGASTITAVVNKKALLSSIPNGGLPGDMLSDNARVRSTQKPVGDVSATISIQVVAPCTGVIGSLGAYTKTTVAASDTNYYTATAINKGNSDTAVLATADSNTTKATGGSGLTAYTQRALTLHGNPANLAVTKGDLVLLTLTKTGTLTIEDVQVFMTVIPAT